MSSLMKLPYNWQEIIPRWFKNSKKLFWNSILKTHQATILLGHLKRPSKECLSWKDDFDEDFFYVIP